MQPQSNPKPNRIDFLALLILAISATAMLVDYMPPKYAGGVMMLSGVLRVISKYLGTKEQQDAYTQGQQLGEELKQDVGVMQAKKPL